MQRAHKMFRKGQKQQKAESTHCSKINLKVLYVGEVFFSKPSLCSRDEIEHIIPLTTDVKC